MWQDEIPILLRHMIADLDNPPKYDNNRLEQLILVSAKLVMAEVEFSTTYTVSVYTHSMSPDPTTSSPADDSFINLVVLKAACLMDGAESRTAAGKSVSFREGPSSFDNRGAAAARLAILKDGWCKAYNDAKFEYENNNSSTAGLAILSPFRLSPYGTGNYR